LFNTFLATGTRKALPCSLNTTIPGKDQAPEMFVNRMISSANRNALLKCFAIERSPVSYHVQAHNKLRERLLFEDRPGYAHLEKSYTIFDI